MHWIIQIVARHRTVFSLLLTSSLSLWMLSADSGRQLEISRFLTFSFFYPFQFTLHQVTRAKYVFADNRKLKEELATASARIAELEEQAAENDRLREFLGFADRFPYRMVPARVMAREPSHRTQGVIISVGENDSIKEYMPIVTKDGVAGKVVETMPHISLAQLLTDPSSRIGVMVKRSRAVGILETEDGKHFSIRHRNHADVSPGDTVLSSGLGGVYPKGLLVGTVTEVKKNGDPLFKRTMVDLSVDFNHLEECFIMQYSTRWSSFRSQLDSLGYNQ